MCPSWFATVGSCCAHSTIPAVSPLLTNCPRDTQCNANSPEVMFSAKPVAITSTPLHWVLLWEAKCVWLSIGHPPSMQNHKGIVLNHCRCWIAILLVITCSTGSECRVPLLGVHVVRIGMLVPDHVFALEAKEGLSIEFRCQFFGKLAKWFLSRNPKLSVLHTWAIQRICLWGLFQVAGPPPMHV